MTEKSAITEQESDRRRDGNECGGAESPRGRLDTRGTVRTDVAGVTVTHIAVGEVTAHSVSTQRHTGGRELGTLVDVLADVVSCCAVSDKTTTDRTPGESTLN